MINSIFNVWLVLGVIFISSLIFSLLINRLFLRFSKNLGIRNTNDETIIRWGPTSKPALGGISFYIVFLLSVVACAIVSNEYSSFFNLKFFGLVTACTLGFIMGLADDAYNTRPWLKFLVQLLCALILIFCGIHIQLFKSDALNYLLTIMWVIGLMNSINMLDNMDAIAAITSFFIILAIIIRLFIHDQGADLNLIVLFAVLAGISGFLFYNWHPSKMFMGDTGSQFMGVFLAAFSAMYLWNDMPNGETQGESLFRGILIPVLAFMLPIIDTTTVIINRLKAGKSPFVGGRDHTTHHLVYLGYNERQVAFIFLGLSINSQLLLWLIQQNNFLSGTWGNIISVVYLLLVFVYLYWPTIYMKA